MSKAEKDFVELLNQIVELSNKIDKHCLLCLYVELKSEIITSYPHDYSCLQYLV